MKFLLFSDLHLDAPFSWLAGKPEVARARRNAIRSALENIVRLAHEERVDTVLCGGDLFEESRVTQDTCSFINARLRDLSPIPVFISPGNHDYLNDSSPYLQSGLPENVRVFQNDRLEPVNLVDGITLWGAAHRAPAYTENFLEGFSVDRTGLNLALFHGSESLMWGSEQGKLPYAPFLAHEIAAAGLSHAFLGHIHTPRDADWLTYPGNPEPLSFGETGERGAVIVEAHADQISRRRCRVAVGSVHDFALDVTGCTSSSEVRDKLVAQAGHFVGLLRVTVTGVLNSDVDLDRVELESALTVPEAVIVRFSNVRSSYDLDAIANESSVRGRFVQDVMSSGRSQEEARRIIVTGLRALEGRDDLEVL